MTAILDPRTTDPTAPEPVAVVDRPVARVAEPVAPVAQPVAPVAEPVAALPEPAPRTPWRPTARDIRTYGSVILGLFVLGMAVQPAPDGPDPSRPLWASALDTITTFGLLALVVGTISGRRWTLCAGLATGAPLLALSVSCPVSGHHEYAAWWGVQLAAAAAMTVLSVVLLRRGRAS